MRWRVVTAGLIASCILAASVAADVGANAAVIGEAELVALDRLQTQYPGLMTYREGSRLTRLYGRVFEMGDTAEQTTQLFLTENADLLAVQAADLAPVTPVLPDGNTLPLMYDEETGTYKLTLVYYTQYRDGVPAFRSDVRLLVRNEPGYPLVWVGSSLKRLGDFHPDFSRATGPDLTQVAQGMTLTSAIEPVIWAGVDDQEVDPVLAWTFKASSEGSSTAADPGKWLYVVDAITGEVLYKESLIVFTDVTGSVHGQATTIPKSDNCNPEVDTAMKYAKVAIGSTTAYANASGNFTIPNGGTSAVTVTSYMDGRYFLMNTAVGSVETLTMSVTPPGPANFMHNQADTSEPIRAQINAYVQANVVRDWVLTQNPSYPTISTQNDMPLYVNRSDLYCPGNAWYDGSSLNFCSSSGSYPNTAYSNVVHHEYGHHLCQTGGTGQGQYGEGVGDSVAVCIADDPILGYGFEGNCSAGIRTASNTMQYPCSSDIHTCAQLLSGCVWSTRNQLVTTFPSTYLSILSKLMLNSIPMHTGSSTINPAIYTDWMTLDTNYYGGAHSAEITAGFQAHNMVPAPPPPNDACANAITACIGSNYTGNNSGATVDGSTTCGTANNSPDVWYKYTPTSGGTATFTLCPTGGGTTYDSVMSIHSGCPGTSANSLGCDDDTCSSGGPSKVVLTVTGGTTYIIRISGYNGASGAYALNIDGPPCGPPDNTPPEPNPMTFATPPAPASTTSITMTASTATDATSPPVYYFFDFVTGGSGGTDSSWQLDTTYTDTGLAPNTSYTYRVAARDSASPANETGYSANFSTATLIQTPASVSCGAATANSIALTAGGWLTNLAVGSSGLYFDSTTTGGNGGINTWVQVATDSATDLTPNTNYTFRVKARNQNSVETPYSPTAAKPTLIETPAGVTFGTVTSDSIVLNAAGTLTNLTVGSSGAYFDSTTTGGDGGINEWVQAASDTATGLSPNTSYTFQVKARNQSSVETVYSPAASKVTLAVVPAAPTLSGATKTTLALDVNANGNPAATEFAVQCTASSPDDSAWTGKYADAGGTASGTAIWLTDAQWGTVTLQSLEPCTTYTFAVQARNSELVETAFGPGSSLGTAGRQGDLNSDDVVNGDDIQAYVNCAIGGGAGCGCANMSVSAFVSCLLDAGACP